MPAHIASNRSLAILWRPPRAYRPIPFPPNSQSGTGWYYGSYLPKVEAGLVDPLNHEILDSGEIVTSSSSASGTK